jgi:penicillin G amidase
MINSIFRSRFIIRILASAAVVAALVATAGFLWLRTSLPGLAENIRIAGLERPVEIVHDRNGTPHINAASTDDAYMSLGYLHARDRLFQMDFMRRLGAGRLSEVIGKPTLALDKTMRTLGVYRLAGETFRRLPADARQAVESYTRGVNAFFRSRSGALPPEFVVLRYTPEPWTHADSLVWGRLMAMRLTGNWRTEALRAALSARLTPSQIDDLWPQDDSDTPPTLASAAHPAFTKLAARMLHHIPAWLDQVSASNSWLLSGNLTQTGKPILANDPHLGFRAPGIWYLARISAPGLDVTGATVPGVPFHVLGHNKRIAWAFTTTDSDTQDLFIEKRAPGAPDQYQTPDGAMKFMTRTETIAVKGAAPTPITIRETLHGPVISDIHDSLKQTAPENHVISLAAVSLRADDMTPLALFKLNRAQNWADFKDAARYFHSPQQNISYADTDGNIGFIAPGRVPVRRSGTGRRPVPGWTGTFDWTGFIPFDALPQTYNPASGRIVNANHRVVAKDYGWFLTDDWASPYRARRIHQMLDVQKPHRMPDSSAIQNDIQSLAAKDVLPDLLRHLSPRNSRAKVIAGRLQNWDAGMSRRAAEPLIFISWLSEVSRALYADELGPHFPAYFRLRPRVVRRMLSSGPKWCDNVATQKVETCGEIVSAAFDTTLQLLEARFGQNIANWRWGAAHQAVFAHPLFGRIPVLKDIADIRIESDGGPFTINRAQPRINSRKEPFASIHGPGYRAIYDLSDLSKSKFAIATGQSGNPLSSFYADTTRAWRDGKYIKIPQTRQSALEQTMGITTLAPAR